ncbi:MAG: TonB-dependent receptor [Pedobacter sp.]|nr:MAG: TonB-dependent receptor [Pedobacter sp.]
MKTLLLLVLIFFSSMVMAQSPSSLQIKGKITDSLTRKPIAQTNVALKNDKNVQIRSTVSSADGSFSFRDISTGNYYIAVNGIGYQTSLIPLTLGTTSKILDNILLKPSSTQLKSVEITAQRPLIKQEIDRISYDVKADPENKVNNVLEMMRKVPLLSVDADDNIQLQGNSNYKILINGKPSGMMERNPRDILRSMPASNIERIEVITTPPAKYDGEGLAGLINIITHKNTMNGSNGTINTNHRFPVGGPGMGGSLTAKSGKFGIFANGGGNLNSTPLLNTSNSRITQGATPTNLWQTGARDYAGKSGYGGLELSYEIDSLNLISAQVNYNANSNESLNTQISSLRNQNTVLQGYELVNNLQGSGDGVDAAFNYQLGSKKDKNRILTFSYRYYSFDNNQFNLVNVFRPIAYNQPDYKQDNTGGSSESTFQIDYVYPVKKLMIEAGAKAILRNNNSRFEFLQKNTGGSFIIDPLRTNGFDNFQNVYSIYNTYQFSFKNWGVKAGLRIEQTEIDAEFLGTGSQFSDQMLNLIPSISMNRKFKDMSSINFGFTTRVQRPGINQLNPFVDRSNPNFESSGNPDLKPMSGHSIEFSYSSFKKLSLNIGLRGMFFDNVIMPRVTTDPLTNITRNSYGNTGSGSMVGINVNMNYPISSKLRATLNLTSNHGRVTGEVNGEKITTQGLMNRGFLSLSYRPAKNWQAAGNVNYNGRNFTLQGSTNDFVTSSFSVSRDLFSNKVSVSFAANNAFDKYRNVVNQFNGPNFIQESFNQNYQRNFTASVNYRFGRLKEGIKRNKRGINNNDVSQGSSL